MRHKPTLLTFLMMCTAALSANAAEREVTIATADPAVTLAGTLLTPDGVTAPPLAVMVTGSGNHTRDQTISGTPMFKVLAEQLQDAGIATLRVDSRGSGRSTGPRALESTTLDRAEDMQAVVAWVREALPDASIGLLGHSEGASIAAELADEPGVQWLVLLGAPARSGREVWVEQQTAGAAEALGNDPEKVAEARAILEEAARLSVEGAPAAALEAVAIRLFAGVGIDEATARGDGSISGFAQRMTDAWMRGFLAYDPAPALDALRIPTLVVYGSHDRLTSPLQNAGRLVELVTSDSHAAFALHVLPGQDHFFLRGEGLPPGEHKAGKMKLSGQLAPLVADWVDTGH